MVFGKSASKKRSGTVSAPKEETDPVVINGKEEVSEALTSPSTATNTTTDPAPSTTGKKEKKDQKVEANNSYFKVIRVDVRDPDTGKIVHSTAELSLKDNGLVNQLHTYAVEVQYDNFNRSKPRVALEQLLMVLDVMKKNESPSSGQVKLMEWLDAEYERFKVKADKLVAEGRISFDALFYILKKKNKAFGRWLDDHVVGGEMISTKYINTGFGKSFEVILQTLKADGHHYFIHNQRFLINQFDLFKPIKELSVQPMNEEVEEFLKSRGRKFVSVALGHHYKQYSKFMIYSRPFGVTMFKADGRIMVDIKTFQRMNPEYATFKELNKVDTNVHYFNDQSRNIAVGEATDGGSVLKTIPENLLYQCWPSLAGFSFSSKKWGEILVSQIADIEFDDTAYDRLVLPADKKTLVRALVDQHQNNRKVFSDIISGKGGGRIFLLHGPPGVGKTLTAEAIAERLHDPLYSVTMGELGTNTTDLEAKLQEILEVASIWNAVILIDEADIFLEQRSDRDIVRNAMVGVFLRLLEYHQGVLFLTTNRVNQFDEAFNSRISVALKYEPLDQSARNTVWTNFLGIIRPDDSSNIELAKRLSEWELNGRQIRTAIQLSQALAQSEGKEIDYEHVHKTLSISAQFEKNFSMDNVTSVRSQPNVEDALQDVHH